MPNDLNTTNPIPSTTVPDSAVLPMPDPQKLVDEALSPDLPVQTPTPPSVPPTTEPVADATLPNLDSGEATPAESMGAPMADEIPLAFASSVPKVETTTTTTTTTPTDAPPVFVPPPTAMAVSPEPEKKKSKMGKVLAAMVGFFLLAGGIIGGYYYYTSNFGQQAEIAAVGDYTQAQCNGCHNGGNLVWRNGRCYVSGTCSGGDTGGGPVDAKVSCSGPAGTFFQCGKTPDGCGGFCVNGVSKTCDQWLKQECNWDPVRGATPTKGACTAAQLSAGWTSCPAGTCGAGSGDYCFNRPGSCNSTVIPRSDGTYVDTGLCGIVGSLSSGTTSGGSFIEKPNLFCTATDVANSVGQCATVGVNGLKYAYFCDLNGCNTSDPACTIVRYTCNGTSGTVSCVQNEEILGASGTFRGTCGKVEQIDVMCGGYTESRTKVNGPCDEETPPPSSAPSPSPSPSSTPAPTLACTGLTKDKADANIKVGTALQFTCTGASTPAGAVNLTYQFRLRKDSGAWQSLTATANKASYTVAALGDYDVQCKTCGTIGNANICDPVWSGATQ